MNPRRAEIYIVTYDLRGSELCERGHVQESGLRSYLSLAEGDYPDSLLSLSLSQREETNSARAVGLPNERHEKELGSRDPLGRFGRPGDVKPHQGQRLSCRRRQGGLFALFFRHRLRRTRQRVFIADLHYRLCSSSYIESLASLSRACF